VSWHNFRYTFATWANPTGESIKTLQTQLGHTDTRLTLDVYTQPMPEAQKLLADKVARVLLPVAPKLEIADQTIGGLTQLKGPNKVARPERVELPTFWFVAVSGNLHLVNPSLRVSICHKSESA
jgi:hypothetical protein